MIFGAIIWYVELKHFAEAWLHRSRWPEVTIKRQYFSRRRRITISYPILMKQAPLERRKRRSYYDFHETNAIRKRKSSYLLLCLCYFRFTKMTSKIPLNVNNMRTVNYIDEQFVAGITESNSTHLGWRQLFQSTSGMREWRHWNFQS